MTGPVADVYDAMGERHATGERALADAVQTVAARHARYVLDQARLALRIMEATPDDSFAPTNAVRALPDYAIMPPRLRAEVTDALVRMIGGTATP